MKTKIIIALIIISTFFAWGQSMLPIPQSQEESGTIKEILEEVINNIANVQEGKPIEIPENLIRKAAHVTEYFIIGAEWMILFIDKKNYRWYLCWLIGFFTGFIDETIQLFSGRGSMISDVYIDSFGAILGITIVYLLLVKFKKKKDTET